MQVGDNAFAEERRKQINDPCTTKREPEPECECQKHGVCGFCLGIWPQK